MKKIAFALALALALATAPVHIDQVATIEVGMVDPPCLVLEATPEELADMDYDGEAWTLENGDGPIYGWASHEDTLIWSEQECVEIS